MYKEPKIGREEWRRKIIAVKRVGGIQRKQVTALRSDVSQSSHRVHRKGTLLHPALPLEALEPNVDDHLERDVEERMYVYLLLTIRNTVIDQGVAITSYLVCMMTIATEKFIDAGQRPGDHLCCRAVR